MLDPSTALAFSVFENPGIFAVLVGSGVSRAASIPTGWELVIALTKRVAALEGVVDEQDWAAWYIARFGERPNYSRLMDLLSQTADERRSILHSAIEATADDISQGRKVPTKAHSAIARLVRERFIRVIITTNFDRLLETALRIEGVEPTVIRSDDDLQGAPPLIHTRCFVLKVHGDYLDTRIRNTTPELDNYSLQMNNILDRIFDEHGLIVCGWSADWDSALRSAITRSPSRRFPTFWASRGEPSQIARDLITHRSGRVILIKDADTFFCDLCEKVDTQARLQRQNPMSADLVVAEVKRNITRVEDRIRLFDVIREEIENSLQKIENGSLRSQVAWSAEEFRRRVQRFESATETLCRVFIVLGLWGDDSEFTIATDALQLFSSTPQRDGLTVWNGLCAYPAMLLLYSYGIGLVKAGRIGTLLRWLSTPLKSNKHDQKIEAVQLLFLWALRGVEEESWKLLAGLDRRKTPLSDHLCEIFSQLYRLESISREDGHLLFSRLEALFSLGYLSVSTTEQKVAEAVASGSQNNFIWVPVGRLAWERAALQEVIAYLKEPETKQSLLTAGFARKSATFLDLSIQNIERVVERMSWTR